MSVRLSYADCDGNGTINPATEILEENNYYPFGLQHQGYNDIANSCRNEEAEAYKLNGKEYEDAFGLNIYEMDLRQLDPAIGRWVVQDPVIHHDYSPYSAFDNNPVYWSDPSGADSQKNITIADLFKKAKSGVTSFEFENGQLVGESFTKNIEATLEQTYLFLEKPTDDNGGGGDGNGNGGGTGSKPYLTNNSKYTIYFKPEGDITINGVKYLDGGSYALAPGKSWYYPIDGVSAPHLKKNMVFKLADNMGIKISNDGLTESMMNFKPKTFASKTLMIVGSMGFESIGNSSTGGWKNENWLNQISANKIINITNSWSAGQIINERTQIPATNWINLFISAGLGGSSKYLQSHEYIKMGPYVR